MYRLVIFGAKISMPLAKAAVIAGASVVSIAAGSFLQVEKVNLGLNKYLV